LRGELTIAPLLFACSQAVLGYFSGRAEESADISFASATWQGALQLVATLIAFLGSPPLPGVTWNFFDVLSFSAFRCNSISPQRLLDRHVVSALLQAHNTVR
jgi:hypothetical protein